ncbi:MAG: hypothetical protein CL701_06715 [Chloroflexi bacterium]|nr:hypothetical protein [Chloroflexota bacterium]|tara:strand:+ start:615 stop:2105 length:1491 start_codon:yes stop_codon:yes gene_type:complete
MAEQSYFMGQDGFSWFVGVVEDRNDPLRLGRVRVRCLGYHTSDLGKLPTTDLPWAHVMHPVTDPSMQGMGSTPSFLVEGSWVVGFFRDTQEKQQPLIIGSLPGIPDEAADNRYGFNDPRGPTSKQVEYAGDVWNGPYPVGGDDYTMPSGHETGESDTNRLAQGGTSETHNSLINRRKQRLRGDPAPHPVNEPEDAADKTGIPTATKPYLQSVSDAAVYETRGFWNEPDPKSIKKDANPYVSSQYPYNHVHESESGHIHEIDDSPNHERLFTQHRSGTFEEIHPNGNKVVKIIGDNYEIVAGSSNVYISGSANITVEGTVRELIKGDYILEVEGNYTQKIHKNHLVKIGAGVSGGNREEEIRGNHAQQINGDRKTRITGLDDTIIEKSRLIIINDTDSLSVVNDIKIGSTAGSITTVAKNNLSTTTVSGITSFKSGDKLNMKSAATMTIHSENTTDWTSAGLVTETFQASHTNNTTGTFDLNVSTEVDIDSALINLN